jgi:hypothetical protein
MQEGIQRGALNPHKGMDTRKFLIAVLIALVVFLGGIYTWTRYSAATSKPYVHNPGKAGDGNTALQKGGTR